MQWKTICNGRRKQHIIPEEQIYVEGILWAGTHKKYLPVSRLSEREASQELVPSERYLTVQGQDSCDNT